MRALEDSLGKRVEITLGKVFEKIEGPFVVWYDKIIKGNLIGYKIKEKDYYENRVFVILKNGTVLPIQFSKIKSVKLA